MTEIRRRHPRRVLRAGGFYSRGIYFVTYLPCALYFRRLVGDAAGMGLSAFSARGRMAASRVHPTMASDLVGRSRAA